MKRFHLVVLVLAVALPAIAQEQPVQFSNNLNTMKQKFEAVNAAIEKIEKTNEITAAELHVDSDISEYEAAAMSAYRTVLDSMKMYAETNGKKGSVQIGKDFEDIVAEHRAKVDKFVPRLAAIDGKVRTGDVRLSRDAIQRFSPQERQEFRRSVTPKADEMYRKEMPKLFPGTTSHLSDAEWQAISSCDSCRLFQPPITFADELGLSVGLDVPRVCPKASSWDLVPHADAALVAGCVAVCIGSAGSACLGCVVGAGATGAALLNGLVKCNANCCTCKWYKPWCCTCRVVCWVGFLGLLA